MPHYRKKPITIEARQLTENNGREIAAWCGGTYYKDEPLGRRGRPVIEINTLEGLHQAAVGDWIIKGVKGEFYPCKPDIFDATYEPEET